MSLSWTLPLPIALAPQTELSLSSILTQCFGSVPGNIAGAWLVYKSIGDLTNLNFSYWYPSSPSVGTWYVNGSNIGADTSTYVSNASFGSAIFQAGDDIGSFSYIYLGSAWYSMVTVAPNLIDLPAGNHEPTPADVVAAAYRFNNYYGFVDNTNDCHNIAEDVAGSVGATLPYDSGSLDPTQNVDGGFWRVVYRGSQANPVPNWQTLVQPGDIVRMGWTAGGQHTTTVLAVNPDGSIVVYDNADSLNGVEGIGIHTVNYDKKTITGDVTIYRLSTDNLYLQAGNVTGETIPGTIFNDKIVGMGNDTLSGGPGNDVFQEQGGTNKIDGGGGRNVVDYTVAASQANLTHNANGSWTVAIGASETDTLSNIQVLQFTDRPIALREVPHFDVDGNGTSDVLLSSGNSLIDWIVQNGTATGGYVIGSPTSFSIVHGIDPIHEAIAGDFNDDGTGDILLQDGGGNLVDWTMHNGTLMGGGFIGNPASFGYSVAGTGDFNGDGTGDILLQNTAGNLADWLVGAGGNNIGNPAPYGYHAVGTGDFNGDGTTDVLLQNSSGNLAEWVMQNGVAIGSTVIGNPTPYGFSFIGTGDFNGDGTTDLLLGNSNGTIGDWIMHNGQAVSANVIGNPASFGYNVVGTGDYNGDGTSDILIQNAAGSLGDWTIKNGVIGSGSATIGNPVPFGFHLA
jgi:hypothetical protein